MSKTKQQVKGSSRKNIQSVESPFEKHMNRHKGLGWAEYKQSSTPILKDCGR